MSKETLIAWLRPQQSKLEGILLEAASEYYKKYSGGNTFNYDARKTGEEMWLLGRGGDLCYDRPTIGFNYSLWYHPKRINTFLRYFTDLIYESRNEKNIEIFDLGAGTGAVLWSVGLVVSGLKENGITCPSIRVINVDTSPFMIIYNYNYLWNKFKAAYPHSESICKNGDYRLNSWSNLEESSCTNIWLCASYLFDHSENINSISTEFKDIIQRYKPNKVLLLSSLQKKPFVDGVADSIEKLNYKSVSASLSDQIFNGPLQALESFRNNISIRHELGLSGTPKWNIDSLYGRVLANKAKLMSLDFNSLNLFIQPERDRTQIRMTPQQIDAAKISSRPSLIVGPAGSGKSVVLTQKIRNLINSSRHGDEYNPHLKILVTTFNKGLVKYLGDWIEQLLDKDKFIRIHDNNGGINSAHSYFKFTNSKSFNIRVMHFDLLPTRLGGVRAYGMTIGDGNIERFHRNKMKIAIDNYAKENSINIDNYQNILNPDFLLDEYHRIIYGYECSNEAEYQNIERKGRGQSPKLKHNSKRRRIIWGAIRNYMQSLRKENIESFIVRRHRFIKKLRSEGFTDKFTHIFVDEFQDCTSSDYEIFYQLLENPNNLTLAGDIAQSINLGTALHIPRSDDQRNFDRKRLEGSFRLPFRVSECIKPLSSLLNKKFGERDGLKSDIINPYKGAPPGSRPIYVYSKSTPEASHKIANIFNSYQKALKLDKVTIFERDEELRSALIEMKIPVETEIILRSKGLEKTCVAWSTRIAVESVNEKEEFVYTILTRTVSLLIVLVFPETLQEYGRILRTLVPERLLYWDAESEKNFKELIHENQVSEEKVDIEDTSEILTPDENDKLELY
jgi:DNA helicase-2/ATP-dependent DNA helicase PcrA